MSLKAALRNFCTGQVTLSQRFLLGIGESVSSTCVIASTVFTKLQCRRRSHAASHPTLSLSSTSRRYVIIAGFYLNAFFLEQACLSPAYVGIIQLVQGTWDTVNDPLLVNYFFISFEQMTEYLTH
jgi:hypothetical protein